MTRWEMDFYYVGGAWLKYDPEAPPGSQGPALSVEDGAVEEAPEPASGSASDRSKGSDIGVYSKVGGAGAIHHWGKFSRLPRAPRREPASGPPGKPA